MADLAAASSEAAAPCPRCRGALTEHAEHSAWCENCGWNADPALTTQTEQSRRQLASAAVGERLSASLLREFQSVDDVKPHLTLAKAAAYLIALAVHLATVALALTGVMLLWLGVTRNFLLLLFAVLFLGMAWVLRPRFPGLRYTPEAPDDVVHIRGLADAVAQAVKTKPADEIVVVGGFKAAVASSGWRRTRVLIIGLPLFAVLNGQERVAVLAHEFAHFANGDPRRGWVVGTALSSLAAWHDVLAPWSLHEGVVERMVTDHTQPMGTSSGPGLAGIGTGLANVFLQTLSYIPLAIYRLLEKLIERESQRAEYLADVIAANIAGSQAVQSSFDLLHLAHAYESAASVMSADRWRHQSLWDEMRWRAAEYPDSERRRARVADRQTAATLGRTHPPTSFRIDAIVARGLVPAQLVIGEARSQEIDADLLHLLPRIQTGIIDKYLDAIYAG